MLNIQNTIISNSWKMSYFSQYTTIRMTFVTYSTLRFMTDKSRNTFGQIIFLGFVKTEV